MRILHLISSSGLFGAENVLLELAAQSKAAGLRVSVGVFENTDNPNLAVVRAARERGFETHLFHCRGKFDRNTVMMIKEQIDRQHVDIVHSHNYKSNFYAWMATTGNGTSWVVTNHGRRQGVRLSLYNILDAFIVRRADRIIAVSEQIAEQLRASGIKGEKIRLIDNGIDVKKYEAEDQAHSMRMSLGMVSDARIIGTIGSLSKEKGHEYLLKAAPEIIGNYPDCVFLIVGDGPMQSRLETMADKLGLRGKVIFAGRRDDIPQLLSTFRVFVLPSLMEGLPLALLEAQAARIPTVASRVGAIPKVIHDGISGLLVDPGDQQGIASAIIQMLSDRGKACDMAERGFQRVRQEYSSETMGNKYLSLYHELLISSGRLP